MIQMKLAGEYRLVVTRGGEVKEDTGWVPNIITDFGLNVITAGLGTVAPFNHCRVGTGTSTPTATQTALDAQVAFKAGPSTTFVNEGAPNYSDLQTRTYVFAQGSVVGNIAEVGVGQLSGGADLFSRSRILDGGGSPTTITVTSIDQLTVVYRLRCTPTLTDISGSVTLAAVSYPWTARMGNIGSFSVFNTMTNGGLGTSVAQVTSYGAGTSLGALTAGPTGTPSGLNTNTGSAAGYISGSFYRDLTVTFSPTQGNATGGIGALNVNFDANSSAQTVQYSFSTPIPKDNTKTLSLTFRISWGR